MRLFKPKYKNKKGEYTEVKKFWCEVVDKREQAYRKVLRFPASESEKLSKTIGDNIEELIEYVALNKPNFDLVKWFQNNADKKLQERLIELGLLPPVKEENSKPLLDYLPEFRKAIYEESKNSKLKKTTTKDISARDVTARVRNIIKDCGFEFARDISAVKNEKNVWEDKFCGPKVNEYLDGRLENDMSQQTAHYYAQAFKRFGKWMFDEGYIAHPPKIRIYSADDENYRRCFEITEFEKLLEAARTGPERKGLTGYQRYILYLLAVETGLRRGELRSLTVASVDLKNLYIFVKGGPDGATKNKKNAIQSISPELGELLREYIRERTKDKLPNVNVKLFPKIHDKIAEVVREDCEAADGIEIENHKGKLQFHSLRHTCGSYLSAFGVHPKEIKEIMRHKDIKLTMGRYGHSLDGYKQEAVKKLSRFARNKAKEKSA